MSISEGILEQIRSDLTQYLFPSLSLALENARLTLKELTKLRESANDWEESITDILEKHFPVLENRTFSEQFPSLTIAINSRLSFFPVEEKREQAVERFKILSQDALPIKLVKSFKIGAFGISRIPFYLVNSFRSDKRPVKRWSHRVPRREIATFYYQICLLEKFSEEKLRLEREVLAELEGLRAFMSSSHENDLGLSEIRNEASESLKRLDKLETQFKAACDEWLVSLHRSFEEAEKRAGTFELNASYFSKSLNRSRKNAVDSRYLDRHASLALSYRTLYDNWALRHEMMSFHGRYQDNIEAFQQGFNNKKLVYNKILGQLLTYLEERKSAYEEGFNDHDQLNKQLKADLSDCQQNFQKEHLPKALRNALSQNLPGLTLGIERHLDESLGQLREKIYLAPEFDPQKEISKKDLKTINPRELVDKTLLPSVRREIAEIKAGLLRINKRLTPLVAQLSNIYSYSLSTTLETASNEQSSIKECSETVLSGIERATQRIHDFLAEVEEEEEEMLKILHNGSESLIIDLEKIQNSKNALELNLRLVESKARARTTSFFKQLRLNFEQGWKRLLIRLRIGSSRLYEFGKSILSRFKEEQAPTGKSLDLSGYLKEAGRAYEKLPFIYRLLFRPEPLTDFNFMVGRKKEIGQLRDGFTEWQSGNRHPLLIVGPRGGGCTSLFNQFENEIDHEDIAVNRIDNDLTIDSLDQLVELLSLSFNYEGCKTLGELREQLEQSGIKRIVFIDELQRYFLRCIGGFEILQQLFSFMNASSGHIFWVCCCSRISYTYLSKTRGIQDHFGRIVELETPSVETLQKLFLKRHEMSGYQLEFDFPSFLKSRKIRDLEPEEQQKQCLRLFCQQVYKNCEGSMQLALFYWVMCAEMADETGISIKPFPELSDPFQHLSGERLHLLYMLLLHDGLSLDDLHLVSGEHRDRMLLHLANFQKDDVVVLEDESYHINILLQWQLIKSLKKRNLIH